MPGGQGASDRRTERPPVLWPVSLTEAPAMAGETDISPLIGRRVVIRSHQHRAAAWSYDMRLMTPPHAYDGERVVGVVPEIDWYRHQRDETYVVVPRPVAIDRVWYEVEQTVSAEDEPVPVPQDDIRARDRSAELVVDVDCPPVRWPRRATSVPAMMAGGRCWIGANSSFRVVSQPYRHEVAGMDLSRGLDGLDEPVHAPVMHVVDEADWYRMIDGYVGTNDEFKIFQVQASLVWLE